MYTVLTTCRKCGGAGSVNKNPCRTCSAAGAVRKPKTVTVTVPPGVDTGMNLRLAAEGDVGDVGAPAGHLFVRVAVEPDDYFQRQGNDVHVRVPIHFTLAALGGEVGVPTLKGEVQLKVPAGSQPGDKLVMRAKGVRSLASGGLGNQVVHLDVEVPQPAQLTPKMKELLAALREEEARVAASKAAEAPAAGAGAGAGAGKGRAKAAAAATPAGEGAAASWSARLTKILQRVVGAGTAKKDS
jgi:molecular chaperone DnaJ